MDFDRLQLRRCDSSSPVRITKHKGIGYRLRLARRAMGLTYSALGELAGMSHATVQNIEIGRTVPGIDTVERLARALSLDPRWFAYGNPDLSQHAVHYMVAPGCDLIKMGQDLRDLLAGNGGYIDDTYKYLDPTGAGQWCALLRQADFASLVSSVPVADVSAKLSALIGKAPLDIVGLGSGTGKQELLLSNGLLSKRHTNLRLILVDISQPLLTHAVSDATSFLSETRSVPIVAIVGDFHELPKYSFLLDGEGPRRRVICMFGYTFGNLENEIRFLRNSLSWVADGDYFLIDVRCTMAPVDRPAEILKRDPAFGSRPKWHDKTQEFITGPILKHSRGIADVGLTASLDRTSCVIPGSYAVELTSEVKYLDGSVKHFSVGYAKRYDLKGLTDCMSREGWDFIEHWPYADGAYMLVLFQRRRPKPAPRRGRPPTHAD